MGNEITVNASSDKTIDPRRRILPILALGLMINVIDRTNIGIAALRMNADIGLSAASYGLGAGIFYIGYCLFEIPSNLALYKFGARRWIFRIMLSWGLVSCAMAFVYDERSFYILRFLLGAAEAGFFPGVIYYLNQWYDKRSLAKITGFIYGVMPLSFAISSPLSTAILMTLGWKWLFVVEGVPALILAFVVLKFLPDSPDSIGVDRHEAGVGRKASTSWRIAFLNPQTLLLCLQYFCLGLGSQIFGFWLPQIIQSMGLGLSWSGGLSALPWLIATIITPIWAAHSSRVDERYWHAILPCLAAALMFVISAFTLRSPGLSIILLSFGMAFNVAAMAAYWAIPRVAVTGAAAAAAVAFINSVGNMSGFVGPYTAGLLREWSGNFQLVLLFLAVPLVIAAGLSAITGRIADPRPPSPKRQ